MSSLTDALRLTASANGLDGTFTADWGQGRAAFGGIVGAWAAAAMASGVPADRPLRSLLLTFVGPLAPGPFSVRPSVLRTGRAVTLMEARLTQGEVVATATGAFGGDRPTRLSWPAPAAPAWGSLDERPSLPFLEGVTPTFTQHFEYRWAHGGLPFSGGDAPRFGGWIRPRDPRPVDVLTVLALLDAWPAPVITMADRPVPISSLTWLANLLAPVDGIPVDGWWRYDTDTVASADGYVDIEGRLWAPDGRLIATSRQLVVEFSG